MGEVGDEGAAITGDAVLIDVLAAAQRFAAWYVEFLSCEAAGEDSAEDAALGGRDQVAARVQHAVFDLIAAVHAMNRHCTAGEARAAVAPGQAAKHSLEPVH
ncbi:MAG: hypothetical protein SNJ73_01925 [Acetobacteraceae bacterium]